MQKSEIIIDKFIETIKESPLDVQGDPVVLNRVFEALDKKKKKRRFIGLFMLASFIIVGSVVMMIGFNYGNDVPKHSKKMTGPSKHQIVFVHEKVAPVVEEKAEVKTAPKTYTKTKKKTQNAKEPSVVTYKFDNHQVDVIGEGSDEFIQINVFGSDGQEQDVLKVMEELKKSYRNNAVTVDSVKNK